MKFAIDLLWVKPKHNGGIESYIRNLLDGFMALPDINEYVLFTAKDNAKTFEHYLEDKRFSMEICDIEAFSVSKRILWQNRHFNKLLIKKGIKYCFTPVYCKPLRRCKKVKYVTTIHDLQQLHFPEYFTKMRRAWMMYCWKRTVKTSDCIVAISEWVKKDILDNFGREDTDVRVILNPIVTDQKKTPFDIIREKYGVGEDKFMFTLCSMLKHKNVMTALKVMEKIKEEDIDLPKKLIIAGISESDENRIVDYINTHNLKENCIMAGFISNEDRNTLFEKSYAFLFPSIFEGFGMPVVEGLMLGSRVVTTKCTSIPEVSKGKAVYVDDPFDVSEWIEKLKSIKGTEKRVIDFPEYEKSYVASQYLKVFESVFKEYD